MLMLDRATEVRREELDAIPTPDGTDTWRPVPHAAVVKALTASAATRGLRITGERFAVLSGTYHPTPETNIELRGARLFGSMDFARVSGIPFPPGCTPSAGLRNSHDKTFALSVLAGARVLVCANGVLSAEHLVSRKHTSGIDLIAAIDSALDAFLDSLRSFHATYERLRSWRLTRADAHSCIIELALNGAFASCDILPVVNEFENPRHEEFKERSGWSLYQAATEVMKKQSPARQVDGLKALSHALLSRVN